MVSLSTSTTARIPSNFDDKALRVLNVLKDPKDLKDFKDFKDPKDL